MKILMTILSLCAAQVVFAQRLPDLQNKVVSVPASVRIDGVDSEWGAEYAAKNRKLDISYSIANDKDFLYLVAKAEKDSKEFSKITTAGLQLAINVDNKNDADKAFKVAYPLMPSGASGGGGGGATITMTVMGASVSSVPVDMKAMERRADSLSRVAVVNRLNRAKEIKVLNFPAVTDSLISIYNEHDIKVASTYNDKNEYVYELAIPLSLLGLTADSAKEISYQLRSNPIVRRPISEQELRANMPPLPPGATITFRGTSGDGGFNEALVPTEVWGKYKLKPVQ